MIGDKCLETEPCFAHGQYGRCLALSVPYDPGTCPFRKKNASDPPTKEMRQAVEEQLRRNRMKPVVKEETIGSLVRTRRGRLLMTQADLAAAAGVSENTITRLEADKSISYDTLKAVAAALKTTVREIVPWT